MPGRKPEAKTLRELRELLGGASQVKIIGWRPIGTAIAKPPLTADRVLASSAAAKQAARVRKHMAEARRQAAEAVELPRVEAAATEIVQSAPAIDPKAERIRQRYERPELAHAARLAGKKRYRERRKARRLSEDAARRQHEIIAKAKREAERQALAEVEAAVAARKAHYSVWPPKSQRNEAWFRSRCTPQQNAALDMWAQGLTGPAIARALGTTTPFVGAHTVTRARLRGDPRAVVRDPINHGKTKRQPRQRRLRNAEAVANRAVAVASCDD